MKKILVILISLIVLGCAEENTGAGELTNFIPESAGFILKTEDPDLFFSNLKNNEFLRKNQSHPFQKDLKEQLSFLRHLPHRLPSYLCFAQTDNDTISYLFISSDIPEEISLDSVKNKKVETITSAAGSIRKYTLEEKITYSSIKDSILLVSDSRELLESSLNGRRSPIAPDFAKALKAASPNQPAIFINHETFGDIFDRLFPGARFIPVRKFSNWTVFDTEITNTGIKLNGITTAQDSLKYINLFQGVTPARNTIAEVTPASATGLYSIAFRDFSVLQNNLRKQEPKQETSAENELLQTATETAIIWMEPAPVFVVSSEEVENARISFTHDSEITDEFREFPIYSYTDTGNFGNLLEPLMDPDSLKYYLILDRYFLFSEDPEALRAIVTQKHNERTLSHTNAYRTAFEHLSTEASILMVANNTGFSEEIAAHVPEEFAKATGDLSFKGFPVTALQFIYQSNYAHIHAILTKAEESRPPNEVSQLSRLNLNAALATPPVLFDNHRSKGKDLAVQDIENTLYLISPEGTIYWKKDLDSRILGRISQVDLYKNGRYQLAFATQNALHVIDRDGNPVKPFPLKFKDEITQPAAIFDYDNKRDYRFVIVQNDRIYMYDNRGRSVSGFSVKKAGSRILQAPKHIRIGNKDYILIPESSGKLNILSRTGKIRVPVKEKIAFSENKWFDHHGSFVSTNQSGELVKISQKGAVTRENMNLAENHRIDATPKTLVSLSENRLRIKDRTLDLDFGLYTAPRIFYVNNKIYVSVTDTQAHRVYVFDSNGKLLPGFPVYGNSAIDLDNLSRNSRPGFTVQGEEDGVLLYEL